MRFSKCTVQRFLFDENDSFSGVESIKLETSVVEVV